MSSNIDSRRPPIAVVGVGAIFPGSVNSTGFWRNILEGRDLITDVPASHWLIEDYYDSDPSAPDKTYAKRGAFLPDVDFDALGWGVPPSIIPATDTSQLLALIVAQRVLEDACQGDFREMDRSRTSVILGVTSAQELLGSMVSRLQRPTWVKGLREAGLPEDKIQEACDNIAANYVPWQESTFPGVLGNVVAGRIANRLDLGGTNCVTDAACASTFSAMSMAVNELYLGQSDLVISGGVDTMNDIFMYMCFSKTPALSASGDCRPFSDQADGTMLGEGIGMVALKRLDDAERDGDKIYAVLQGVGTSSDGRSKSVYAPVSSGQANALRRAYDAAGYGADTVELLEAHGTGTKAGDAAEFEGLRMVFDESGREDRQWCALGSVKSQIGHTKAAAGAAGLFKAVMALHHKVLPPMIKVDRPNPKLDLKASPFHINTTPRPWVRPSDHPRRASVSSFGFGGSNFHLALEEYTDPAHRATRLGVLPYQLVVLTGADGPTVAQSARTHAAAAHKPGYLQWLAQHSQAHSDTSSHARLAIVAKDEVELQQKLEKAAAQIEKAPQESFSTLDHVHFGYGSQEGKIAFLFPGQGSQYVDMGASLAIHFEDVLNTWDQVADVPLGTSEALHDVVFPKTSFDEDGPSQQHKQLTRTEWAQPAIGAVSLSMLSLLEKMGLSADFVGGHSFGEVTALHAAGVLSDAALIRVARKRGELMAEAAKNPGAMTAVVAPIERVKELLAQRSNDDVVVANHNGPKQVVLSGTTDAIADVEKAWTELGIKTRRLPVATAFHSKIVSASSQPFGAFLEDVPFTAARIPVFSNTHAEPYPNNAIEQRALLAKQLGEPVRFVEQVKAMYAAGARTFVEVGPGSVLTNLVGEILDGESHTRVSLDRKKRDGTRSLFDALATLVAAGAPLNFDVLSQGVRPVANPHEIAQPKLAVPLNGANYGKPYPPKEGAAGLPPENPPIPAPEPKVIEVPVEVLVEVPVEVPVYIEAPAGAQNGTSMSAQNSRPATGFPAQNQSIQENQPTQMAPTSQGTPGTAWLSAYQQAQLQTAEAHASYQQTMAQAHAAFLKTAEVGLMALSNLMVGQSTTPAVQLPAQITQPAVTPMPAQTVQHAPAQANYAPQAQRAQMHTATAAPAPARTVAPPPPAPAAPPTRTPAPIAPPPPTPPTTAPSQDMEALMLSVVAEKTGYPAEMLTMEMELESDLGIDSIKRVEILSTMQEREPALPEVDATEMAALQTLGQIVDYMQKQLGAASTSSQPTQHITAPTTMAAPATAPSQDMEALMLSVVAEKTGYPAEMLTMEMELESDLGIDSIKRVEILSTMQEREPALPEVDATEMAALQTLGQIVNYMQKQIGTSAVAPAQIAPTPVATAAPVTAPSQDMEALMLSVVAEKTGYPAEMLTMEMELESDLGIDSIKRVEILSTMQEREPALPEVDATEMAALQTLGQIVGYMQKQLGVSSTPTATTTSHAPASRERAPTTPTAAAAPSQDMEALMLSVVAEKTGYPAEMLSMEMELESDLGIDSIKRVEILSTMQEREPALPEVDATEMAALQTLGQIVGYMQKQLGVVTLGKEVSAEKPPDSQARASADFGRFSLRSVHAPALGMSTIDSRAIGEVLVTDDGTGVARALVTELKRRGVNALFVATPPSKARNIVFLGGLRAISTVDEALFINREAFRAAQSVAKNLSDNEGLFVTVQDTGGTFGLTDCDDTRAYLGGLPGLVKTASQEWPQASVKAIDIARGDRSAEVIAKAIAEELLFGGPTLEVGLSVDGQRTTLQSVPTKVQVGSTFVNKGDVVVVSGGARGVTAATLIALAKKVQPKFVLLGRTALEDEPASCHSLTSDAELKRALLQEAKASGTMVTPAALGRQVRRILANREIRATLRSLEAAGSPARYVPVDVTAQADVSRALDAVRAEWGPITGLIHAAGVLADKHISQKLQEQFDFVFNTKVNGLRALLSATQSDPLSMLCFFSSVAGRCGNAGQCDYAMANEILNKVAQAEQRRRGSNVLVRSMGWGPWEGGMVTPALKKHFEARGVPMISLATGANMLVDELASQQAGQVELVLGGAPKAEALLTTDQPKSLDLHVFVDRESHPYLTSHSIKGAPVVPVVLVMEWFTRAAKAFKEELTLASIKELKVLRGLVLKNFDSTGDRFTIKCEQISNGNGIVVGLSLLSGDDKPHYTAKAELLPQYAGPSVEGAPQLSLQGWGSKPIYDGEILFHGPDFQVIESMEGVSKEGISATLHGVKGTEWPQELWQTDVAAFDGGLQLALLWCNHVLGGASLPTGIQQVQTWLEKAPAGKIRCVLKGRETSQFRTLSDVLFFDQKGSVIAEFSGVETHLLPG